MYKPQINPFKITFNPKNKQQTLCQLTNSFDIIKWALDEITYMDTEIWKLKANIKRLFVEIENGGKGLIQVESTYKLTT